MAGNISFNLNYHAQELSEAISNDIQEKIGNLNQPDAREKECEVGCMYWSLNLPVGAIGMSAYHVGKAVVRVVELALRVAKLSLVFLALVFVGYGCCDAVNKEFLISAQLAWASVNRTVGTVAQLTIHAVGVFAGMFHIRLGLHVMKTAVDIDNQLDRYDTQLEERLRA